MASVQTSRILARRNERKTHSGLIVADDITSTGVVTQLDKVGQGITRTTRVGNDINMQNIRVRATLAGGDSTGFVRNMILIDKNEADAPITVAEVLGVPSSGIVSNTAILNRKRFRILRDRVYQFTANGKNTNWINFKIPLKGLNRQYSDILGDTGHNALWMLCISDSGVVPHPKITFESELDFTDP